MTAIKFIYFDLGNVLLNFNHDRGCRQLSELTGVSVERVQEILFTNGMQQRYETGQITTEEFHQHFCDETQTDASLADVCQAASNIFTPMDTTIQLAHALKQVGHRLGLLSNTCDCHWQFCIKDSRFGFLHELFETTVLSYAVGHMKPEADIYRIAANLADCDPGSILFIDDKIENTTAAKQFGFDVIHFQGISSLIPELIKRKLIQS
ncbi:MAG: HAD family hydrolase [Pirellulales bacterium]|jgi:FMN phosphatase YigB (HAD superfamily)